MNAAAPERKPATEEISGLIERVTFHNDESGLLPAANENTGVSRGSYGDWGAALSDCWSVRRSVLLTFKVFAVRKDFLMVSRRRQRLVARLRV